MQPLSSALILRNSMVISAEEEVSASMPAKYLFFPVGTAINFNRVVMPERILS